MPERKFKVIPAVLVIALLAAMGLVAYELVELNRPISRPPLPNPNGYDDFVRAGRLLVGDPFYFNHTNVVQLQSNITSNAEALHLIRQGLTKKCLIARPFSTNYISDRRTELMATKRLAWLLEADAKLAELEHCTNDAASVCFEIIRFGRETCRGGVMIDRLVGLACEGIGRETLQKIVNGLGAQQCRTGIGELRITLANEEPTEDVLRNEEIWLRINSSLRERLQSWIPISRFNPVKRMRQNFVKNCQRSELQLKRLMIDLAVRAYELDHGRHPENLSALVPDYLDSIPTDPTTGTNLTYLP
jgi:hypothetical protein